MVPFFRWKLDMSILLGCDIIPSFFCLFFYQISDIISTYNSFFEKWGTYCSAHKNHDKTEPGLFKEEFTCSQMLCLCSKTYCCYDRKSNKYKFSSKGLNKRTLVDCGDGPITKYRKVVEEAVNVTSTNRGFQTMKHGVATYEQTKK